MSNTNSNQWTVEGVGENGATISTSEDVIILSYEEQDNAAGFYPDHVLELGREEAVKLAHALLEAAQ